jgi:hypothetical protein
MPKKIAGPEPENEAPKTVGDVTRDRRQEEVAQLMHEVEELAQRIARAWASPRTAGELLEEQRR